MGLMRWFDAVTTKDTPVSAAKPLPVAVVPNTAGLAGNLPVTLYSSGTPVGAQTGTTTAQVGAASVGLVTASLNYTSNGTGWRAVTRPVSSARIPSSGASVNATSAKATAGDLHRVTGLNAKASVVYVKLYDKASAPTVGTDTPVITLACPALAPFDFKIDGFYFSAGIAFGLTTDAADAGTTALLAGDVLGLNVFYT